MPVHNEAKVGEIAKTVVMPGDPMRAKYIAENFLEDYKLVNQVRGMYAYTGEYEGKLKYSPSTDFLVYNGSYWEYRCNLLQSNRLWFAFLIRNPRL